MANTYEEIEKIPSGDAPDQIVDGCVVLEGGAFRGVYTSGVLDRMMELGINMQTTIGVSAGALNAYNYVAGQIGRSARFNLKLRHDQRYVGASAMVHDKGLFGFDMVFRDYGIVEKLNRERFDDPARRLIAVATNCETGEPEFFERGICTQINQAIRASASMPVVSKMVDVEGKKCLDGGCSCNTPVEWAVEQGFEKIIVIKTREHGFRKEPLSGKMEKAYKALYRKYPAFVDALLDGNDRYNRECELIEKLAEEERIYLIEPSYPVEVSRLDPNMDKLGALYFQGYWDLDRQVSELKNYLGLEE